MVEVTYQIVLSTLQTVGLLVGIFYYVTTMRNAEKNRMIDMVSRRAQQANNYDYQTRVRQIDPMHTGWSTSEEFHQKYSFKDTPELNISRAIVQTTMNHWGFLFKEGVIGLEFIERLYNPWAIIRYWESFSPLILEVREVMGSPKHFADLEYLYNALKKKYPNLNAKTKFSFQLGITKY